MFGSQPNKLFARSAIPRESTPKARLVYGSNLSASSGDTKSTAGDENQELRMGNLGSQLQHLTSNIRPILSQIVTLFIPDTRTRVTIDSGLSKTEINKR